MEAHIESILQRVLVLEGGCNLRDLGGYRTTDGRRVREGVLFRSGVLSYFSPNDHPHLERLGLRAICDLRRADEREREPTRWPANIPTTFWELGDQLTAAQQSGALEGSTDGAHARTLMIEAYRTMPSWLRPHLRGVFGCLIKGDVPLLFHCAAGKDRTGLCAALVLHGLGVPRETIYQDYELTNRAVDLHAFLVKHGRARLGVTSAKHPLETMDADVRAALLAADKAYLSAAFEEIEKDHGSIDSYVRDILGVSDREKEQLRDALLSG